jgi:hypothetical protein
MANEQETAEVTALAKKYPEVAAEIKAIEISLENYAQANAVQPSASVKQKVFAEIKNPSGQAAKIVSIRSSWNYAAAVAIVLLISSIALNVVYYIKYKDANNNYAAAENEKNKAEKQLALMQQSNQEMKSDMNVIQSRYSEPVALHGLEAAPDAAAKIFWMKNTGDVYIDPSNLPDAPAGMQYQLWGIVDGKPVDGGMIVINKTGDKFRIQKMKSFGKAEAFAVTLETAGGNPTPKGDMYVMGKM